MGRGERVTEAGSNFASVVPVKTLEEMGLVLISVVKKSSHIFQCPICKGDNLIVGVIFYGLVCEDLNEWLSEMMAFLLVDNYRRYFITTIEYNEEVLYLSIHRQCQVNSDFYTDAQMLDLDILQLLESDIYYTLCSTILRDNQRWCDDIKL